ncbi:MAG TPA: ABATE domain-containing protein [Nitrospira sp.]
MDLPVLTNNPFLFVGNQAALDFVNTDLVLDGNPTDLLPSIEALISWSIQAGLVTKEEAKQIEQARGRHDAETLKQVKAFRTTMREMAERLAAGRPVLQATIEAVNLALRHRLGYPQVSRRRGAFERTYQTEVKNPKQLLGPLAEAASDLLTACDPSLVKKCQNPACVLLFYDTTKNHARHWCSMSLCGNRSKVAAHYQRHRNRKT